jgi:hypothetical protein
MIAMQYSVRLPAGCDVNEALSRVEKRRKLFPGLEGLIHKTYLYDEEERLYAPIYLWNDQEAARDFLIGGLFANVIATFGRPRVRTWHVLDFDFGPASGAPAAACFESDRVDAEQSLPDLLDIERREHQRSLENPSLYARVIALDADRWEIARMSFWAKEDALPEGKADCVQTYRVLEVCDCGGRKAAG